MSRRQRNGGHIYAAGSPIARGVARDSNLSSPRALTFSDPLEPVYLPDAPLNVGRALGLLLLLGLLSAAFLGAALWVNFISTFV